MIIGLLWLAATHAKAAPNARSDLWVTNGAVYSSVTYGNNSGYSTGAGAGLDTVSGLLDTSFPKVVGTVNVVIANGANGWYIGGSFTSVGGVARNNLARINADKTVDADWDPDTNGEIHAMLLSGNTLVVGGAFTQIAGVARNRLAALIVTLNTNMATDWNPDADGTVLTMMLLGATLYAGGEFTLIGGLDRIHIAAIDANLDEDGNTVITSWAPDANVNGFVRTMVMSGDGLTLYVGGDFTSIGGKTRNRIAALDVGTDTNNATVWNPNADGSVRTLIRSSNTLYAGGDFVSIGGKNRNRIAALNTLIDISNATEWDPDSNGIVRTMMLVDSLLYAGGDFTVIGGKNRDHIAALQTNINTNNATGWKPGLDGPVYGMTRTSTTIYAGGVFNAVTDDSRLYIGGDFTYVGPNNGSGVGIDIALAQASTAFPLVNGPVYVALSDGANGWYIGGAFSDVGGVTRNNIAHIEKSGASYIVEAAWDPDADGAVNTMVLSGGTLYVGGAFAAIGGANRNNIASIATADGSADPAWDPDADGPVNTMVLSGGTLYVGGAFAAIGGANRNNIASIATADGSADPVWNPDINNSVHTILLDGATLYAGGDFTVISGLVRKHIAAVSVAGSGLPTNWLINAGNSVYALSLSADGMIYSGGTFTSIGGVVRNRIAALNLINGSATSWDPGANSIVRTMVMSADTSRLFIGGDFTVAGGNTRNRIAALDRISGVATSWNPDANGAVYTMLLNSAGTNLYVGGAFTTFGSGSDMVTRNRVASLFANVTNNAAIVDNWNPNATDGAVRAMALFGTTLYVGGDFTAAGTIGNEKRNYVAALRTSNNSATAWDPDADSSVHTMSISTDGRLLYVGGEFTTFDGGNIARNHIAVLDTTTVVATDMLTTWDPDANDIVRAMSLSKDETTLYIGGDFTTLAGGAQTRNRMAALVTDNGSPVSWWPGDGNGDDIINGYPGTLVNGVGFIVGKVDQAFSFDGVDDYVYIPSFIFPAGNFTWDMWITRQDLNTVDNLVTWKIDNRNLAIARLLDASSGNNNGFEFLILNDNIADFRIIYQQPIPANDWIHLAVTADGATGRLYIDGVEVAADDYSTGIPSGSADLLFGIDDDLSTAAFKGSIDEAEIFNRALSAQEIVAIYNAGGTGRCKPGVCTTPPGKPHSWWNTGTDAPVYSVALSEDGRSLYAGGPYTQIDSNARSHFAALETSLPVTHAYPAAGAYSSAQDITLLCDDGFGSNCAATYYTTDGSIPTISTPYTGPFTINADTTIKFFSIDNAGNQEAVQTVSYVIETVAPVTTATPSGGALGIGENVITLICSDSGGGGCGNTYYTLDGTAPTASSLVYASPITLQDDATLQFFSVDNAGNIETPINSETYFVDISVPRTTASPATRVFDTSKLTISLSCDDTPIEAEAPGVGDIPEGTFDPDAGVFIPDEPFNNPDPGDFTTTAGVVFISAIINTGTGCAATYYTTDGTTPTTASTPYTGPFNITDNTIIKFFSVDAVGNTEGVKRESYISHKSSIGMLGPFTIWLCLIGIGIHFYCRHQSCG